jgi:tetratricopeptide (TPR) repeat protein
LSALAWGLAKLQAGRDNQHDLRRGKGMLSYNCILPAVVLLFSGQAAQAADTAAKERAAKTACLAGDFANGVAILSELYVSTNEPAYLFNQGRCFEQNHRYDDAVSRFQEYLRVGKKLSKAGKADAQKHIGDCQKLLAQQSGAGAAPAAPAGTASSHEAKERAAKKACLTGDPVHGVEILADLFIDTNDTTYLFNQGRCFEQNRHYEDAIGRFREYLMKAKNLGAEAKADAEKHIAACESYLGTKTAEPAKSEPARKVDEAPAASPPTPEPVVVTGRREVDAGHAGAGLRASGVVLAALGGAGLITGVILNLKTNAMSGDLESEYDASVASNRKTYKAIAWVGYGAGAACLAGGALLYYLGWRQGQGPSALALAPTVGPELTGMLVRGAF